ncbi:MAG TPA: M6 family metalloprotease domain-containing protein [Anaerolineaceae bacterium]|nr:M6 family metalloprotease domain-containing protein [Anaerolineaceae bacterium]
MQFIPKSLLRPFIFAAFISFLFIMIAVAPANAAPADPQILPMTQPDGTTILVRQWGDEWNNGYETAGGYSIVKDSATGYWVYADRAIGGTLAPAKVDMRSLVVGRDQPVSLKPGIRPQTLQANPNQLSSLSIAPFDHNFGAQKLLVLLVDFTNQAGKTPVADIAGRFFGATNSVNSYYKEVSRDQFSFIPAAETSGTANDGVIGWLHMNYPHINTGGVIDGRNQQLVKDALMAADSYIDYAAYDTNNDGYISANELHIIVIVAGYEAAYDQSAFPSVWGHRWNLNFVTPPILDGKILADGNHGGGYAQFGEIHRLAYNPAQDHLATIGIMVHELGHDISWPDLYDTTYNTSGVGDWSIMGGGSWNGIAGGEPGSSPAHPDAFSLYYQGWIKPVPFSGPLNTLSLASIETNGDIYLLGDNPGGVDWNFMTHSGQGEYFLVENRQKVGYDAGLKGCGLLIWHIDETRTFTNAANNGTHPLVYLEQADGLDSLMAGFSRGDAGDPFPGSTHNTSFTPQTNPNSNYYSGSQSGFKVTDISASDCSAPATITANFSHSYLSLVPFLATSGVHGLYGYVNEAGIPAPGINLNLLFFDGSGWDIVATAATGADGYYSFPNAKTLAAGQFYTVEYNNSEGNSSRLASWYTKNITLYTAGQVVNAGNFDLKGITLSTPANAAIQPVPANFTWIARIQLPTDSYQVKILELSGFIDIYSSDPLGFTNSFSLVSLPPGLAFGTQYGWYVGITSPDGGYGTSYNYFTLTFSTSTPALPSNPVPGLVFPQKMPR